MAMTEELNATEPVIPTTNLDHVSLLSKSIFFICRPLFDTLSGLQEQYSISLTVSSFSFLFFCLSERIIIYYY